MPAENSDLTKDLIELLGGGMVGSAARELVGWLRGHRKESAEARATELDAQTRQFQAVAASYSARVDDLSTEVHKLREEITSLRQAYDAQQNNHTTQMLAMQKVHLEQMEALRDELEEARKARGIGL